MRHRKKIAFTLIELLVVISIIALLMGILLPYLGHAREQSRRAVCMANLHSIGQSIYIYANDNDDKLIPGDYPFGMVIWGPRLEGSDAFEESNKQVNLGYLITSGILPIPEDNDHIFFCPSSRLPDGSLPFGGFAERWNCPGRKAYIPYMFNTALDGFGNQVLEGEEAVLAHKDKINYLFGDGSVHRFRNTRIEFPGSEHELIQDVAARIGVCFPDILIHKWLEQDRIDVAQALEYLNNPAEWMDRNSALSVYKPVLLTEIANKSLVCDVVGARQDLESFQSG